MRVDANGNEHDQLDMVWGDQNPQDLLLVNQEVVAAASVQQQRSSNGPPAAPGNPAAAPRGGAGVVVGERDHEAAAAHQRHSNDPPAAPVDPAAAPEDPVAASVQEHRHNMGNDPPPAAPRDPPAAAAPAVQPPHVQLQHSNNNNNHVNQYNRPNNFPQADVTNTQMATAVGLQLRGDFFNHSSLVINGVSSEDDAEVAQLSSSHSSSSGPWWQCVLASSKQRLASLLIHERLYDLTLTFPKQRVQMKAHKLILAMSSPVFSAMLIGPLAKYDDEEGRHITLPEDNPQVFAWLLNYMYRDDSTLSGATQALEIYVAAHKFQMTKLAETCSMYLGEVVDPECFAFVFDAALLHDDKELTERCFEVASLEGKDILNSSDIVVLSRASLRALLTLPRLCVDRESVVFRAVVRWAWFQLDEDSPQPLRPDANANPSLLPVWRRLRNVIEEFFQHVRFLAMDLNEFLTEVEPSGILTSQECMAILQGIQAGTVGKPSVLPPFVSWGVTKRRRSKMWVTMLLDVSPPPPIVLAHYNQVNMKLLHNFRVSQEVHMVRLAAIGVSSLKNGAVKIWSEEGMVGKGVWTGSEVVFRRPVLLKEGYVYSVVLSGEAVWCALASNIIVVTHRRIAFQGETQCVCRLRLEYLPTEKFPPPVKCSRISPTVPYDSVPENL